MYERGLGLALSLLLLAAAHASIHEYSNGGFSPQMNAFSFYAGSEGLYAPSTTGNGKSFIKFDLLTFRRTNESASKHGEMEHITGLIEAIIFDIKDKDLIGLASYSGETALCCTPDLAKLEGCKQGHIIIRQSSNETDWPRSISFVFQGNDLETKTQPDTIYIPKTGMYNLYFMFCDKQLKDTVINGRTLWKNPTGYLPGRLEPLMRFYGCLSLVYIILGLIWFLQNVRFWKDITQLQNCISAVIFLCMLEMTLCYFEYANFNATGRRPVSITFWAVTFGAIKKTVSRLLLLVVSMGYGVTRPTLGGITSKVALLGIIYFMASEALELVENAGNINDVPREGRTLFVIPVAVLDALFIIWIFTSLSKTLEKLHVRKSFAKLDLYRKFTNALAVAVLFSVAFIGYELYFKITDPFNENWETSWIIIALWNSLSFVLLCVVCFLWAPSQNVTRYAFSDEAGNAFDEEELVALTGGIVKPKVNVSIKQDVFSLGEETEEDKRE
ncbi:hypothetical protein SUGI_0608920 [Cryptomeria japonica]|uniref:uncharacterized protein LOC131071452 n=1 Tax=Cryptomeria japonica TaxID=3369 RepID=UPI002414BABC|nr:uncharacterized protein LOC131071452 [Cryptomeria japonica]XP_057863275.2 uncharacterized protein LOC131071452 [Cryptomeria japonica]XP_057863276.2 uncharacterized protein LOC131071452 [Cryptomeria japonica]GLJ30724.1 hypothetical protein SUGI_0608920 [Cryptomeria japonica]